MKRKIMQFICGGILFLWLAGCSNLGTAFSPEQAVIREVNNLPKGSNLIIDQGSIQVRQTVQFAQETYVMVSYAQMEGVRRDQCLMVYGATRIGLGGWIANGGGGGCSGSVVGADPAAAPVEVGSNQSSGSTPADPGESQAYGLVHQADIVKVRVSWADGHVQDVSVINNSYLATRSGAASVQRVEGLSAAGEVLYTSETTVAPGKQ